MSHRSILWVILVLSALSGFTSKAFAKKTINPNIEHDWHAFRTGAIPLIAANQFPYQSCFESSAKKENLPVPLLLALARGESNFNAHAESKAKAHGIMQIQWPGTAKDLGFTSIAQLRDPCRNIHGGARYLRQMIDRYDGNYHLALAAYNYGPGRIKRHHRVPEGAKWYSSYIYNHLDFIIQMVGNYDGHQNYKDVKQKFLLLFSRPYQAEGYVSFLRKQLSELRFDWFKNLKKGGFEVVVIYSSDRELKKAKQHLMKKGFSFR